MSWPIIVAIVLVIPIILLPAAFVWYMNVSGLFQVMKESRLRQRKREQALKAVEGSVER